MGRLVFIFLLFFVNRFLCFVQFFTIIIIKCKASFSCHSSSSHYSTQGFVLILFHYVNSYRLPYSVLGFKLHQNI